MNTDTPLRDADDAREAILAKKHRALLAWASEGDAGKIFEEVDGNNLTAHADESYCGIPLIELALELGDKKSPTAAKALWKGIRDRADPELTTDFLGLILDNMTAESGRPWAALLQEVLTKALAGAETPDPQWWSETTNLHPLGRIGALVAGGHFVKNIGGHLDRIFARGVSPNLAGEDGSTNLLFLASSGHPDILGALLRNGANPAWKNHTWQTPGEDCYKRVRVMLRDNEGSWERDECETDTLTTRLKWAESNFGTLTALLTGPELERERFRLEERRSALLGSFRERVGPETAARIDAVLLERAVASAPRAPRMRM